MHASHFLRTPISWPYQKRTIGRSEASAYKTAEPGTATNEQSLDYRAKAK